MILSHSRSFVCFKYIKSSGNATWGCRDKKGKPIGPFCIDCHIVATDGWACEGLDAEGVLKKLQAKEKSVVSQFKFGLRVRRGEASLPNETLQAGQKIGLRIKAEVGVLFSEPFLEKFEVNLADVPDMPIASKLLGPSGSQSDKELVTLLIFKSEDVEKVRAAGLPAHRAEVFSETFNLMLENKMEAPVRVEQGRLTFSRINAATWKERSPAMQLSALSAPQGWDDIMELLEAHQKGLGEQEDQGGEDDAQESESEDDDEEPSKVALLGASTVGLGATVKNKIKRKAKGKAKGKAAATRAGKAAARGSRGSSFRSPSKVGTGRGSDDAAWSSKQSGSARVSVACDVTDKGEPVWKTVDPNKLATGEEELDKRLNGEFNLMISFIVCVLTLALML